jgi:enoyl-CoA hydratase
MIQRHDSVGTTVLEIQHGRANALDVELLDSLTETLEKLEEGSRGVVLTGSESIFCAGIDLPRLLESDRSYTQKLIESLDTCLKEMIDFPRPLVAAINGHAVAGGLILACACDYRVLGSPEAKMGLTELAVGVPFPPLAFEVVRQAVGLPTARRLVLGAELIGSQGAKEMGVVDEVVSSAELRDRASQIAGKWSKVSPITYRLTKQQLSSDLKARMGRHSTDLGEAVVETWGSEDTRAAIGRFVSRTLSQPKI